jgi:hypothetical protein
LGFPGVPPWHILKRHNGESPPTGMRNGPISKTAGLMKIPGRQPYARCIDGYSYSVAKGFCGNTNPHKALCYTLIYLLVKKESIPGYIGKTT